MAKAKVLGESSTEVIRRILQSRTFTEQAFAACIGLLRLSGQYGPQRFENACKRALPAPRVSYRMIDNILTNNLDKQVEDEISLLPEIPDHENIRGSESYQ
jgi:hypothetical protein